MQRGSAFKIQLTHHPLNELVCLAGLERPVRVVAGIQAEQDEFLWKLPHGPTQTLRGQVLSFAS